MALVKEITRNVFRQENIGKGYLVYARHVSWPAGRSGFVTDVTEEEITIQYFPGIGSITNHFVIHLDEVTAGKWQIRWSEDLSMVEELQEGEIL